jgi:hypothetical protein
MNNYYKSYYCHGTSTMYYGNIAKASSKKRSSIRSSKKMPSTKYDVAIKVKATSTRIIDINNVIVRFESNDKGQVTGKHYSGVHWSEFKKYRDPNDYSLVFTMVNRFLSKPLVLVSTTTFGFDIFPFICLYCIECNYKKNITNREPIVVYRTT